MKIAAVVVTYNRLEKLKNTLKFYSEITEGPDYLFVVNNNSSDGTGIYLSEWEKLKENFNKKVLTMNENLGGAGGFFYGCIEAMKYNPNWILLADDDAYPDKNVIVNFKDYIQSNDAKKVSALCSSVYKVDNTIDYGHRKFIKYKWWIRPVLIPSTTLDYKKEVFNIDLFSYVGVFLNVNVLREVGLCNPNFFIYYDDMEHSLRLGKVGKILCIPSAKFVHDDGYGQAKAREQYIMSWRDYYDIRNKIYVFLRHKPIVGIFWTLSRLFVCFNKYSRSLKCQRLYLIAIFDGIRGKLGKHSKYKPGFSIIKSGS